MTDQSPITPPTELINKWSTEANRQDCVSYTKSIAIDAAQWGADQELDACCEWLERNYNYPRVDHPLRAARRPKPPSRKEQALEAIGRLCASVIHDDLKNDAATIRRALEALDD